METCPTCGEQNPDRARFCLGCGQPLLTATEESRKVVSVLFADVVGSTGLGEQHDPEAYRQVLHGHFDRFHRIITQHGGTVEKYIGDAVMAIFGLPVVHEDDALRAVRAAVAMRDEVARAAASAAPLHLSWRIGVNTGEVLAGGAGGRTLATGDAVNVAARLEQAAGPGEVLIGAATYDLVRDAVDAERLPPLEVRGRSQPVAAFRIDGLRTTVDGRARRFDLSFVGRSDELAVIDWVLHRVRSTSRAHLLTVCGDPGVGKTRLLRTALADRSARVLWGRCLPYGDGVAFWPFTEALMAAADIDRGDAPDEVHAKLAALAEPGTVAPTVVRHVAALTGLTDEVPQGAATTALRAYLGAVAPETGLVLVIDDVHNADPALLDTIDALVSHTWERPVLTVALGRRELLEVRPGWGGGRLDAVSLLLEPLPADEAGTLIAERFVGDVDTDLRDALTAAAGGNPLFLEELVAMLLEEGAVRRGPAGRWVRAAPELELRIPASIQTLLAARVDALEPTDRAVLGRVAVGGQEVTTGSLLALTPEHERPGLPERVAMLIERGLLRPTADGCGFRHQFIRDAVYGGLTRRTRAALHERYAQHLRDEVGGPRHEEFIAYHLERALEERARLDEGAPELTGLRARVADQLIVAGRRALERGDMPAAVRLLGRGLDRLGDADPRRAAVLADRGLALAESGRFPEAQAEFERAMDAADASGDRRLRTHTLITSVWTTSNLDLEGWVDHAAEVADEAVLLFEEEGDDRGLARAWGLRAEIHYLRARYQAAEEALHRAATHAARAGDPVEERKHTIGAAFVLPWGPRPVAEAVRACDLLLDRYAGDRAAEGRVLQTLALLRAMAGDTVAARDALGAAVERFEELGQTYWLATSAVVRGHVELCAGELAVAEAALRDATVSLGDMGDREQAASVAALLAAQLPDERADEIEQLVETARHDVAPDDVEAQVRLRLARARLAAARGRIVDAEELGGGAVEQAATCDGVVLQADAYAQLADAAAALGRYDEADRAAVAALERYEAKGHRVGAARVRDRWPDTVRLSPPRDGAAR